MTPLPLELEGTVIEWKRTGSGAYAPKAWRFTMQDKGCQLSDIKFEKARVWARSTMGTQCAVTELFYADSVLTVSAQLDSTAKFLFTAVRAGGYVRARVILMPQYAPRPPIDRVLRLLSDERKVTNPVTIRSFVFERRDILRHSSVLGNALTSPLQFPSCGGHSLVAIEFFHAIASGSWYTKELSLKDLQECARFAYEYGCDMMLQDCERLLCERVSASSVLDLRALAEALGLSGLGAKCRSFVSSTEGKKAIMEGLGSDPDQLLAMLQHKRQKTGSSPE